MIKERLEEEQSFHDHRFDSDENRKSLSKYYSVRIRIAERRFDILSKCCNGKKVLEYGCGSGTGSERLLKLGAILTGIDISNEGIRKARERRKKSQYKADYLVMNAEKTDFDDDTFDVAVGLGILHHLDLPKAYGELCRVLKKDGHAIFEEPLGHNPFINFYRIVTPALRTSGEHPLKKGDIELLRKYFHNVEVEYFTLVTLLAVPFRKMFFFKRLYYFLEKIDRTIFVASFIRKYAWTVIIHASHPKKEILL